MGGSPLAQNGLAAGVRPGVGVQNAPSPSVPGGVYGRFKVLANDSAAAAARRSRFTLRRARRTPSAPLLMGRFPPVFSGKAARNAGAMRRVPFEAAVRADVDSGILNRALNTDEPLVHTGDEPAGDAHVFFEISDLEMHPDETRFALTYVVRGRDGYGREETQRYSLPTDRDMPLYARLRQIDGAALSIVRRFDMGRGLFRDWTRRVHFKGKYGGGRHTLYYKGGGVRGAEEAGRRVLDAFGVMTPAMYPSAAEDAFWMQAIEGGGMLAVNGGDAFLHVERYFSDIGIDVETSIKRMADFGRMAAAMFFTGNGDFHRGQVLFAGDRGVALDLETVGIPNVVNGARVYVSGMADVEDYLNQVLYAFTFSLLVSNRILPTPYVDALEVGVDEALRTAIDEPARMDRMVRSLGGDVRTRIVLRASQEYVDAGLAHAVPHYTMVVDGASMQSLVANRVDLIRRQYDAHEARWYPNPFVEFRRTAGR